MDLARGHVELKSRIKEKKKSTKQHKKAQKWHPSAEPSMTLKLKEGTMTLRGIIATWHEENPSESLHGSILLNSHTNSH